MSRRPYIAGNWKMFKTVLEAERFVQGLLPRIAAVDDAIDVAVCSQPLALTALVDSVRGSRLKVLGQNMHQAAEGAYTGEVSAAMLADAEVTGVLLGHSERRQFFNETDAALAEKVPAALKAGLEVVLCVGESEQERKDGLTESRLEAQLSAALASVEGAVSDSLVVAYEPIWAIGTGLSASAEQAQETIAHVRKVVTQLLTDGADVRVIYGGSVKPDNAAELLSQPDIDGALVGGASLELDSFEAIVRAAL